ncbi:MAG: aromatic amino acid aminotransferase [Rhodobacterales bacterium]|nr:MAG: aromatic amino acid aminotransferase [Rhodobacterales bacterium]
MFETLTDLPADKILALMDAYRADPRTDKIDLGVGIYKNAKGETPVMRAVKAAEKRIWETQDTKKYTGLAGEAAYSEAMIGLLFGGNAPDLAAIATPGGTGAVRQAVELVKMARPGATIWLSDPTWPNHPSIIDHMGVTRKSYRYFDNATCAVDEAGMLEDLAKVEAGDVVLLHGCCHNPTGANPTADQWDKIVAVLQDRGAVPFIDIAYQGFGDGLEDDAAATRKITAAFPEVMIAASCSKNFGIYRERTGLLMVKSGEKAIMQKTLNHLNRQNYSFPPDHGARIVTEILSNADLRADWEAELEETRLGMLELRQQLASELRQQTNSDAFDFVAQHRGMFSRLGLTPEQVEKLKADHGVYMVGDSRINIAGLNADTVPLLAKAVASVLD